MACVLYHLYRDGDVLEGLCNYAADGGGGLKVTFTEIGPNLY